MARERSRARSHGHFTDERGGHQGRRTMAPTPSALIRGIALTDFARFGYSQTGETEDNNDYGRKWWRRAGIEPGSENGLLAHLRT